VGEHQYINFYRCPDDETVWVMNWSCMCDDRCPKCNHEIEPYKSEALAGGQSRENAPRSASH
jgi:hypothetical protein